MSARSYFGPKSKTDRLCRDLKEMGLFQYDIRYYFDAITRAMPGWRFTLVARRPYAPEDSMMLTDDTVDGVELAVRHATLKIDEGSPPEPEVARARPGGATAEPGDD